MRVYTGGKCGFGGVWSLRASVVPRSFTAALPNAVITFFVAYAIENEPWDEEMARNAQILWVSFTSVMFFVLFFRSNVAYARWWEGGTLLQQTRGEWFNSYSSIIAFSSVDPSRQDEVEVFHHMIARLMSLLFCHGLQQVSPDKDRPLEIIDTHGFDWQSLEFLKESSDKVEVILQWIQRLTVLNMASGILPIPAPVMSRAFQEISRGIVNLQNARKIADFPFPFPYAQTSAFMLVVHWAAMPIISAIVLRKDIAALTSFVVVFFTWCVHHIAVQLEQPFGYDANDLPMYQMQHEWNMSLSTLLLRRAQQPPKFEFNAGVHRKLETSLSDGTWQRRRTMKLPSPDKGERLGISTSSVGASDMSSVSHFHVSVGHLSRGARTQETVLQSSSSAIQSTLSPRGDKSSKSVGALSARTAKTTRSLRQNLPVASRSDVSLSSLPVPPKFEDSAAASVSWDLDQIDAPDEEDNLSWQQLRKPRQIRASLGTYGGRDEAGPSSALVVDVGDRVIVDYNGEEFTARINDRLGEWGFGVSYGNGDLEDIEASRIRRRAPPRTGGARLRQVSAAVAHHQQGAAQHRSNGTSGPNPLRVTSSTVAATPRPQHPPSTDPPVAAIADPMADAPGS